MDIIFFILEKGLNWEFRCYPKRSIWQEYFADQGAVRTPNFF